MALTKVQKNTIVSETLDLLLSSKITVMAIYAGTNVTAMQTLRKQALEGKTTVKIIKNRLVIKALQQSDIFKSIDTSFLNGQLLYAFNPDDEILPAQALSNFAKISQSLSFVGALTNDGRFISAEDVQALANLPTKDQLRGQLVSVICSPLSGFVGVLNGNIRGVLNVLGARASQLET
ncbi:MAG TPA: 50S ribosomal protein L10 [Candidatus Saccharimonadales bacterium]|jgi:large subunit ribosomal protein L10|nr:50S ribosomal protein L10 [Candidatus Saccharimonadales bacterium]